MVVQTFTSRDYKTDTHNTWCAGCGDFGVLNAIQAGLAELQLPPHEVAVVSGIGCSGKAPHYINAYGFHTLHGRALPVATGVKLANPNLTVLAVGGDGDGYGIGAGYFMNSGRRNVDLTYLVFNNGVYGLTKGQASPTMPKGLKTKGMAEPAVQDNINPLALAIASGYTFVARGYALEPKRLARLIAQAVQHRGTAFIDILQTCPVYNDLYTKEWYAEKTGSNGRARLFYLDDEGYDGRVADPTNVDEVVEKKVHAIARSYEWGANIPLGVFYQMEVPTFEEQLGQGGLRRDRLPVEENFEYRDLTRLMDSFR
ncbi:MAG: 2-oxoacid:ferredoxin oxidoreductase subunit beta [Chloroflexi bacterium]|nr:2-oxoacid:ferredoxin oxidoreductase subunit beta [Chloroflexota bacterium]